MSELRRKDPRAFWKHLKGNRKSATQPNITGTEFFHYFKQLGESYTVVDDAETELFIDDIDKQDCVEQNVDTYLDAPITANEINNAISKLN
jgi:hypothetical protein